MRAFIAIEIPFNSRIGELQDSIDGRVKLVERENMHITLKFLGDVDEKLLEKIEAIIGSCKVEPFTLNLKGVGFFPNERYVRVIWVGVENWEPVVKMAKCIDEKLNSLGFKKERDYTPHLTVARAKGPVRIKDLDKFIGMEFGNVDVREVKIKKSTLTPSGPIYEDVFVIQL